MFQLEQVKKENWEIEHLEKKVWQFVRQVVVDSYCCVTVELMLSRYSVAFQIKKNSISDKSLFCSSSRQI